MIIESFEPFIGQHCETTATGSLLKHLGMDLSEPMMYGLGESLAFGYFLFKGMDHPFIGGRLRSGEITENLCRNLNLELRIKETTSVKKAWKNIATEIDQGKAVGLQLDCYHLDYFTKKIHFAGHFVGMYGYDDEYAYLVDTGQQGSRSKTTLESLAMARNERGPMSAKNKSYTIDRKTDSLAPEQVIRQAIRANAQAFLNPPIKNLGYKGILKCSAEILKWWDKSEDRKKDYQQIAMLMERAGTGGSIFRNIYRDFVFESGKILKDKAFEDIGKKYRKIALDWKQVSDLFHEAGETGQKHYLEQASAILKNLSVSEKQAMEALGRICA